LFNVNRFDIWLEQGIETVSRKQRCFLVETLRFFRPTNNSPAKRLVDVFADIEVNQVKYLAEERG
jgi:hypothetical protein